MSVSNHPIITQYILHHQHQSPKTDHEQRTMDHDGSHPHFVKDCQALYLIVLWGMEIMLKAMIAFSILIMCLIQLHIL